MAPSLDRRRFGRWVRTLAAGRPGDPPLAVAAAVADAVADAAGTHRGRPPHSTMAAGGPLRPEERPEPGWCSPLLPGLVYESLTDPADRRRRGAWFTPPVVVDALVGLALDDGFDPRQVLDPACGGGAFLIGVADALWRRGTDPDDVLARLVGVDLDPGAVAVSRWALELWAAAAGARSGGAVLRCGDALGDALGGQPGVDLVVGNPPFATPLRADDAGSVAERYRSARPHLGPYADAAACFLDRSSELVAPGGRLVLVLPQSLLASRDAAGLRRRLEGRWRLRHLWVAPAPVFAAAVHVFAPVLERGPVGPAGRTALHGGLDVTAHGSVPDGGPWSEAAASALGVPVVDVPAGPVLGSLATASSGFRDEFYGLVAACREAADGPGGAPVVTVGQIDPLWWRRDGPVRFGRRRWDEPVVDVERLPPPVVGWAERQRRPKVLLATQTRVLEPLVDRHGDVLAATPVITVQAAPEVLDRVAAVLLAPPVVALAARRSVGSALHPDAIKLAARQVLELPLPRGHGPWADAAAVVASVDGGRPSEEALWAIATLMCQAYGVEVEPLRSWWWTRLPSPPGTPPSPRGGAGRVGP